MDIENQQQIALTLEVVPEAPQDADLALVDAVGRDTAEELRSIGLSSLIKSYPSDFGKVSQSRTSISFEYTMISFRRIPS